MLPIVSIIHNASTPYMNVPMLISYSKVSEYDQKIPQSYTTDHPTALRGRTREHLQ